MDEEKDYADDLELIAKAGGWVARRGWAADDVEDAISECQARYLKRMTEEKHQPLNGKKLFGWAARYMGKRLAKRQSRRNRNIGALGVGFAEDDWQDVHSAASTPSLDMLRFLDDLEERLTEEEAAILTALLVGETQMATAEAVGVTRSRVRAVLEKVRELAGTHTELEVPWKERGLGLMRQRDHGRAQPLVVVTPAFPVTIGDDAVIVVAPARMPDDGEGDDLLTLDELMASGVVAVGTEPGAQLPPGCWKPFLVRFGRVWCYDLLRSPDWEPFDVIRGEDWDDALADVPFLVVWRSSRIHMCMDAGADDGDVPAGWETIATVMQADGWDEFSVLAVVDPDAWWWAWPPGVPPEAQASFDTVAAVLGPLRDKEGSTFTNADWRPLAVVEGEVLRWRPSSSNGWVAIGVDYLPDEDGHLSLVVVWRRPVDIS